MKKWNRSILTFFSILSSSVLLTACLENQQVNVSQYDEGFSEINMNKPGTSQNISVPIDKNNLPGADYLRTHSVSLYMEDETPKTTGVENNSEQSSKISGTGFIINTYANRNEVNAEGEAINDDERIHLLIGTNLHVAKAFFPNEDLIKVNHPEDKSSPKLSETQNGASKKFRVGFFNYGSSQIEIKGAEKANFNLYQSDEPLIRNNEISEERNIYLDVDSKNVELVYTATNLAINKKLFNFDQNINLLDVYRDEISSQKLSDIEWVDSYNPGLNNPFIKTADINQQYSQFNFAVDFAVLKISFEKNQQPNWLKTFNERMQTNDVNFSAIPTNRNFVLENNLMTPQYLVGGYSTLTVDQKIDELVGTAEPVFQLKPNQKIDDILPSEITAANWHDYFAVSNLNPKLEFFGLENFQSNDDQGYLFFEGSVRNQTTSAEEYVATKKVSDIISGFKAIRPNRNNPNLVAPTTPFRHGEPIVKWIEAEVKNGTFSDKSIYTIANELWNQKIYSRDSYFTNEHFRQANVDQNSDLVTYNGQNFLSIGSKILTTNLNLKPGSSGSLVISDQWFRPNSPRTGLNLIGIYNGTKEYINPIYQTKRHVGQFLLFSSAFRYELFQARNKLSKPSLCDVLDHKGITGQLANSYVTCPDIDDNN
ncbi:hypothetical protein J2Z62_000233 [Mycoplasmoides fastidiosum]|uniref:DUF31 domain-containing protein n=1 Tax=Mycoplasmoides fastidiosum TaxID=92758 RepID=A0ABU0LYW7_9BACT|nr:hypothetical protein [Mycoplasmoides fastidiosum]MDQ0513795.1 hypothetical protein [Mycoplasmoides fastidiosum]UUD37787.1 hypothetical protein NPA10_00085 [Mycoplasmoides fastidiosum]